MTPGRMLVAWVAALGGRLALRSRPGAGSGRGAGAAVIDVGLAAIDVGIDPRPGLDVTNPGPDGWSLLFEEFCLSH